MKFLIQNTFFFLIAALLGGLSYIAFTNNYAYKQTTLQLTGLRQAVLNAPLWKYGVIESINATSSSMTVRFGSGLSFEVQVPADAYIARQDLIGANNVYTAATTPIPATFADMQPGNNVVVVLATGESGKRFANIILFGNPL